MENKIKLVPIWKQENGYKAEMFISDAHSDQQDMQHMWLSFNTYRELAL